MPTYYLHPCTTFFQSLQEPPPPPPHLLPISLSYSFLAFLSRFLSLHTPSTTLFCFSSRLFSVFSVNIYPCQVVRHELKIRQPSRQVSLTPTFLYHSLRPAHLPLNAPLVKAPQTFVHTLHTAQHITVDAATSIHTQGYSDGRDRARLFRLPVKN